MNNQIKNPLLAFGTPAKVVINGTQATHPQLIEAYTKVIAENPDGDNTTICGYYIERTSVDDGDVHFKKSHVKAIRPTCVTGRRDARLDGLIGKSVLIDFRNGDTEAGFLRRITTTCGDGDIVRYCLVTPLRNIVFYSTDIKGVREG